MRRTRDRILVDPGSRCEKTAYEIHIATRRRRNHTAQIQLAQDGKIGRQGKHLCLALEHRHVILARQHLRGRSTEPLLEGRRQRANLWRLSWKVHRIVIPGTLHDQFATTGVKRHRGTRIAQ